MSVICTPLVVLQDGHILREGSTPEGGAFLPPTLLPREESRGYCILPLTGQAPTAREVTRGGVAREAATLRRGYLPNTHHASPLIKNREHHHRVRGRYCGDLGEFFILFCYNFIAIFCNFAGVTKHFNKTNTLLIR
jgi:hypothetical protein